MFATLRLIVDILPLLIAAMIAVEDAIPGQGKGEQKLAAVRGILEAGYGGVVELWPKIESVAGTLVTLFNATGVFKK